MWLTEQNASHTVLFICPRPLIRHWSATVLITPVTTCDSATLTHELLTFKMRDRLTGTVYLTSLLAGPQVHSHLIGVHTHSCHSISKSKENEAWIGGEVCSKTGESSSVFFTYVWCSLGYDLFLVDLSIWGDTEVLTTLTYTFSLPNVFYCSLEASREKTADILQTEKASPFLRGTWPSPPTPTRSFTVRTFILSIYMQATSTIQEKVIHPQEKT